MKMAVSMGTSSETYGDIYGKIRFLISRQLGKSRIFLDRNGILKIDVKMIHVFGLIFAWGREMGYNQALLEI